MFSLFVLLLCAHCLADFLFETGILIRLRGILPVLVVHSAIHGLTVYAVLRQWNHWQLPVLITTTHFLIDYVTTRRHPGPSWFVIEQSAHILVRLGGTLLFNDLAGESARNFDHPATGIHGLLLASGFSVVVFGAGRFIGGISQRLIEGNDRLNEKIDGGLLDGGKRIGQLERALIFILFLINQPGGIGFLVTAKSILRFKEAEDQALAEYILIGSLWSFTLGIGFSWLTVRALEQFS